MRDYKMAVQSAIDLIFEGEGLKEACETCEISRQTFYKTIAEYPLLADNYARACAARADKDADEIIAIADGDLDPQRARNRIEARKWRASKQHPKRYGERLDVNVQAQIDLTAAINQQIEHVNTVVLPTRYLEEQANTQAIEYTDSNVHDDTGSESVLLDETEEKKRRDFFT